MAQKAAKTLAARNSALLRRTHLITLVLHSLFLFLHFVFSRPARLTPYVLLTLPTLAIEFYFERLGRPRYASSSSSADGSATASLRSPGEDLDAPGLTEYFWDVLYWTWGCMGAVCVFGDKAWWGWIVVPLYSGYLAFSMVMGLKKGGLPGMPAMGGGSDADADMGGADSKRQKKLEKRGQKVKYR